ncbi:hypothetical protein MMC30_004017 [Trapelia coarctata]|nr:hypothetical protein [Trapelia coarctata]
MPAAVYSVLLDKYISLLSTFYTDVASPLDVPEKDSHGDIDLLVSNPIHPITTQALASALNAVSTISGGGTTSFAVPYPDFPDNYIQLDIHKCPPSTFRWELFTNSHGDLWNILGTSVRAFGLTANNVGFYLRIAEIEKLDRKKSMVFLTSDPDDVLQFLGLDGERYWKPFGTVEELCVYATRMRFFRRKTYLREILKANDRKRMGQRPLYRMFVGEWLPQRPGVGEEGVDEMVTRESVLEEALERYGVRKVYEGMLRTWREERAELERKQEGREVRREIVKEEMAYADAWIEASRRGTIVQEGVGV